MSNLAYNFHPADTLSFSAETECTRDAASAHKHTSEQLDAQKEMTASNRVGDLVIEVLSGLNQGDTLKIEGSPIIVGGNDECDLYLAEPNIDSPCVRVENLAGRACIKPIEGAAVPVYFGTIGKLDKVVGRQFLDSDHQFCIGGVWLSVYQANPVKAKASTKNLGVPYKSKQLSDREFTTARLAKPKLGKKSLFWDLCKAGSVVMSSLGICALTISVAQGVSQGSEYPTSQAIDQQTIHQQTLQAPKHSFTQASKSFDLQTKSAPASHPQNVINKQHYEASFTSDQLRYLQTVFSNMLVERELPPSIDLEFKDDKFIVKGALVAKKEAVLERMVTRFRNEQGLNADFEISVKPNISALPFEIIQVTSGKYGNIVTESGQRLFVGDTQGGYQLVAIQDHQLVFAGKSRITVSW